MGALMKKLSDRHGSLHSPVVCLMPPRRYPDSGGPGKILPQNRQAGVPPGCFMGLNQRFPKNFSLTYLLAYLYVTLEKITDSFRTQRTSRRREAEGIRGWCGWTTRGKLSAVAMWTKTSRFRYGPRGSPLVSLSSTRTRTPEN